MKQKSKVLKSISTTLVLQSSSKWFINNSLYKYNTWIYSADWSDPKSAAFNYFSLLALRILASQCHCWRSRRRCHHLRHAEASAVHEKITRWRLVPTSDPERKMDHYQQEERLFGVSQVLCDPATPPLPPPPPRALKFPPPKFRVDLLSNQASSIWFIAIQRRRWFICRM